MQEGDDGVSFYSWHSTVNCKSITNNTKTKLKNGLENYFRQYFAKMLSSAITNKAYHNKKTHS